MSDALVTLNQLSIAETYSKAYHDSTVENRFMPIDGGQFTGGVFGSTVVVGDDGVFDLSLGSVFELNPTSSIAVSFVNVPENACSCFSSIIKIEENQESGDGGGDEADDDDNEETDDEDINVVWPDNIDWNGKSIPSFDVGKTYVLTFLSNNGGSSWFGCVSVSEDAPTAEVEAMTDEQIDEAWSLA